MFFRVFWFYWFASFWRFVITVDLQKEGICPPVLDIIILFDTSGGNDTVFEQQKNWTIQIVRDLPIHEDAVRVGLVQYSDDAKTEFNLSKYSERNDIINHLETLTFMPGEDTRTGVALNKADDEIFNYTGGARLKATRLIIIFTDGISMDKPSKAAKTLRRKGVKIYTISVNSIGFVPEMLGIVGDADNVFGPTDEERIEERLLSEVEHSRSCEVQPKRNEKTTSRFSSNTTPIIPITTTVTKSLGTISVEHITTTTVVTTTNSPLTDGITSSSEDVDSENNVEDIGKHDTDPILTVNVLENVISSSPPTSSSWKEPVQLFTVEAESTQENRVQNLTNLKTSLAEETNTSESKDKEDKIDKLEEELKTEPVHLAELSSSTSSELSTGTVVNPEGTRTTNVINSISTVPPTVTTICINPPMTTVPTIRATSGSSRLTTKSFLVKLGVEKEIDPISKFLGRDVSNPNLIKEDEEVKNDLFKNSSVEKNSKKSKTFGKDNSSETKEKTSRIPTSSPSTTTIRSVFSTRVTFRPFSSTTKTSPTTRTTTPRSSTTTQKSVTKISSSKLHSKVFTTTTSKSTTNLSIESSTTTSTPTRKFTPIQKSSSLFQTLSAVTAFPTLLSMEKAVTLPINRSVGVSKPIKKKIRRIIKRRRNILPASQAKKVTDKVLEVKRVPTPTTPPIRSTLRPVIIEEKEEETFISGVQCPMDILFVVDSSGSIARTYDTQKDYLTQLIKRVEPSRSHRVGLIQFAGPHIQKMEWSFDTHSKNSQLLSAIRSVRHLTGTTYIGAALELSLILLDSRRKHTETTVILISDGFSQDDSTQQAKLLRQLPNVKMYAISLNKLTNTKYLTDIVGDRKNLFINDESKWFEEFFTKKLRCVPTTR